MMKKIALLMFGMLFALIVAGQSNLYILNEDFIGNDFPEGWTKAGVGTNNWYVRPVSVLAERLTRCNSHGLRGSMAPHALCHLRSI